MSQNSPHQIYNEDEAKAAIKKYTSLADAANKAGADPDDMKALTTSLQEAVTAYGAGDLNQVFNKIIDTQTKLDDIVTALDGTIFGRKIPWKRYTSFVFPIYGAWALLDALIFFAFYTVLLWSWRSWYQFIHQYLPLTHLGFGIPIWAGLVAGIGASIQIIVGVTADVRADGYVEKYRRLWYTFLPIVGPVFGVIAYILLFLGLLPSLGGATAQQLGKQPFSVILVCFLVGYSTEWFMRILANLTK